MPYSIPSVLTVAGSDCSGGAGVQADIKTIQAFGLYAQSVITSLTAQNTEGVHGVFDVAPEFVRAQIDAVFDDIRPEAVKVGMVSSSAIVEALAKGLLAHGAQNIVIDPVMVSTSGSRLIERSAQDLLVRTLFPHATLITPNIPEAEVLTGLKIESREDMEEAARRLASMTSGSVLVKGGHGVHDADDLLFSDGSMHWFEGERVQTRNTHGTGCTLSSAIASGLASGNSLEESILAGKRYVACALAAGFDLGKGSGPLDHMWAYRDE